MRAVKFVSDFGARYVQKPFAALASFLGLTILRLFVECRATALGCWGEDSNLLRLKVSANRFEAGPNPASRFFRGALYAVVDK